MPSKRFENSSTLTQAARGELPLMRRPWFESLRANLPIPVLLLLLIPLGWLVEDTVRLSFLDSALVDPYFRRIVMLAGFNIILAVSLQLINGFSGQFSLGHAGFMAVGAYMAAYPALNLSNRLTEPAACVWFYFTLAILVGVVGTLLILLFWGLRATRLVHRSLP